MKTSTILLLLAGVAIVGYVAYTQGQVSGRQGQSSIDNSIMGVLQAW